VSIADVTLERHVRLHGSVVTSGTITEHAHAIVDGVIQQQQALELGDITCAAASAPAAGKDVLVTGHRTLTLSPGSYRKVFLEPGSDLSIATGTYFIDSLKLSFGSTLRIDTSAGPVRIYARSVVELHGSVKDAAEHPERILLVYGGNAPVFVDRPFRGTLVAPNASLRVASCGREEHKGAFFAKDLDVEPGTTIHAMPFTENWLP
jgi:hypothetical protein